MNELKKIYIISYFNLGEKLAGGLRANELYKYLKQQKRDVEIITRNESEGYETIISDYKLPAILRKGFHLFFPDSSITWVLKLYSFFKDKKNIILIVTTPPHGLLYLQLLLKNKKSIKFINDFRDPFTLNAHPQKNFVFRKFLNKRIEKYIARNSDHIILNTEEHKKIFLSEYQLEFKHSVIRNGYMHENLNERTAKRGLVYFGGHYGGKITDVLFEFMNALNSKSSKNYILDVYGEFHPNYEKHKSVFNYCGLKNRDELVNLLLDYKIGLVCYTEHFQGRGVATKFYEILGLGLTPYCINPSNDLLALMEELDCGGYCYMEKVEQIDVTFFDNFSPEVHAAKSFEKIKKYSRENQNSLFIKVMDDL